MAIKAAKEAIKAAMNVAMKALDDISAYAYEDENIVCYWNLPIVRKNREKSV